ncbi:polyphosphate kinase 2 family protein [Marinicella sp. S1101]|uniref:PPK2 family polyphosphate kinase n=1 Tax=Marinicella marina TaxID=2996016 RepID=UPI002260CA68|nr:PPK2 family polyphosphate kinase [Marinicella marina]MCX7554105.1 polyphosphate kinase 2 family protein [Marinicella marina]MDJ1141202.1 polyphosphate kinase 2 family protein [Marinicella marina]
MPKVKAFKFQNNLPRPSQSQLNEFIVNNSMSLKKSSKQLAKLHAALNAEGKQAVLVIFQALDAAGKDSTIRNVFKYCDPAALDVASFKAPSKLEAAHDFMWRCYDKFPAKGQLTVFNRSYYEETLVVKVHPEFLKGQGIDKKPNKAFWQQRYDFINQVEAHLVASGTQVIKFFLDVSQEVQHNRFIRRYSTPDKQWKFNTGDLKESLLWDQYQKAFDTLLKKTSTKHAPWYVIPANDKPNMRTIVAETIKQHLKLMNCQYPAMAEFSEDELELIDDLVSKNN